MSKPIISIQGISKRYRLGQIGMTSLRDDLQRVNAWFRNLNKPASEKQALANKKDFWALRDVSFDVMPGEVVGIIGRNGAGKSTLLKVLSRITEPTHGEIRMRGRIGSLLEVGTGFHPELSGRDNIFLNGSILGMTRREIASKFDEIVAFAEVEKFIDTPVKRYSSGMYVRLAFAIAAHLEPEILIIDEVLAVGDASFQRKCITKMQEVSRRDGRTILFVSHSMETILRLCNKTILLKGGTVQAIGSPNEITPQYFQDAAEVVVPNHKYDLSKRTRNVEGSARFVSFEYEVISNPPANYAYSGCALRVKVGILAQKDTKGDGLAFYLETQEGIKVLNFDIQRFCHDFVLKEGYNELEITTGALPVNPTTLMPSLWLSNMSMGVLIDELRCFGKLEFMAPPGSPFNSGKLHDSIMSPTGANIILR